MKLQSGFLVLSLLGELRFKVDGAARGKLGLADIVVLGNDNGEVLNEAWNEAEMLAIWGALWIYVTHFQERLNCGE